MKLTRVVNGDLQEFDVSYRVDAGQVICCCPAGIAEGSFDLRNRGMDLQLEITCWPRRSTEYGRLTTGGHEPKRRPVNEHELWQLAVMAGSQHEFEELRERYLKAEPEKQQQIMAMRVAEYPGAHSRVRGAIKRSEAYRLAEAILSGRAKGSE